MKKKYLFILFAAGLCLFFNSCNFITDFSQRNVVVNVYNFTDQVVIPNYYVTGECVKDFHLINSRAIYPMESGKKSLTPATLTFGWNPTIEAHEGAIFNFELDFYKKSGERLNFRNIYTYEDLQVDESVEYDVVLLPTVLPFAISQEEYDAAGRDNLNFLYCLYEKAGDSGYYTLSERLWERIELKDYLVFIKSVEKQNEGDVTFRKNSENIRLKSFMRVISEE